MQKIKGLPFSVKPYIGLQKKTYYEIIDTDGCEFSSGYTKQEAEFLVKACNNYDKLVEALKHCIICAESYSDASRMGQAVITIARLMLKEVGE